MELKSNYTTDGKYLAVITKNGLWIKDINDEKTLFINAASIDQNLLLNAFISEFDNNYELVRNIKSPKIDISKKEWVIENAEVYIQNSKEIFNTVMYFLKHPELMREQILSYNKTLNEIKSKSSTADEVSAILTKYIVS